MSQAQPDGYAANGQANGGGAEMNGQTGTEAASGGETDTPVNRTAAKMPPTPETTPRGTPPIDIRCGPLLRYWGMMDAAPDVWRGSVMIVTRDRTSQYGEQGPVLDLALGREAGDAVTVPAKRIHAEFGLSWWRFDFSVKMRDVEMPVSYVINGDSERSRTFYVPALGQEMNIMFHSCNGFSLAVDVAKFKGSLWKDVLRKHAQKPFHVMLGGGDQLYCDSITMYTNAIQQWASERRTHKKNKIKFTDTDTEEVSKFYITNYMSWFGHGFWKGKHDPVHLEDLPLAMAQIPMINVFDDHDIIDGFGTYRDATMRTPVFQSIGNLAFKYYMLFQHMVSPSESPDAEASYVASRAPGPYIKQKSRSVYARLGRSVAFYGLDCRTERTHNQVCTPETYRAMFDRLKKEIAASSGQIKHVLLMLGVPLAYPRMVFLERMLTSRAMAPIKALTKHGFMSGLTNEFDGQIELLDDLEDHWCATDHKKERNWLVESLQEFGRTNGVRITILSGDVHLAGVGRFYSPRKDVASRPETDDKYLLNVISSAIVNTPPPDALADFLNKRNKIHHLGHPRHAEEDMASLFTVDVDGSDRNNSRLMPRRNYCTIAICGENGDANTTRKPGPIWREALDKRVSTEFDYPALPTGLSIVINVERNMADTESRTMPYEILVPPLLTGPNSSGTNNVRTAQSAANLQQNSVPNSTANRPASVQ